MLDGIRSIFRSSRTTDKARTKTDIDGTPESQDQTPTPTTAIRLKTNENKTDPGKAMVKARNTHTRLSGGAMWTKNQRNSEISEGGDPASSLSPASSMAPHVDEQTPSFARPTKSTRTKTSVALRGHTPNSPVMRTRRAPIVAAPTGSPQRSSRYRRSVISIQQKSTNLPRSAGSVKSNFSFKPDTDHPNANAKDVTSDLAKKLNDINSCIEMLCRKVTVETALSQRERYLRVSRTTDNLRKLLMVL